jgi:hypothetical protein
MLRAAFAGIFTLGLLGAAASGAPADFTGIWVHDKDEGILGGLFGQGDEDISRVVITAQGVNAVRIHLYGRCTPECDWGSELARAHYESPKSDAVRSLLADFKTPSGTKRLVIRPGAGRALRFELFTDFTDHSGRHDYEMAGSLRLAPVSPPVVAQAAQAAPSAAAAAAAPAEALPAAPVPVARTAVEAAEDCVRINPEDVFMGPGARGGWVVRDYEHVILDFGADKLAAAKATQVMNYYHFDEQCYIARPKPKMIYWRIAGSLPRETLKGQDCLDIQPDAVTVQGGKVFSGTRQVLDYAEDGASAAKAAAVLRSYSVTRQCFAAKPNDKMVYWLSK